MRVRSTSRARRYMIRRSRFMRSAMAGRCTLSTAWRPSRSTHAWTWAIEAADSGAGSTSANSSAAGGAEVVLDDGDGLVGGERRDVVERAQAGVGQGSGEHARRRGDHLAELHVGRPERHERLDQPGGRGVGERTPGGGVVPEAQDVAGAASDVDDHGPADEQADDQPDLRAPGGLAPAEPGQARGLGRRHGVERVGHPQSMAPARPRPASRTRSTVAAWTSTTRPRKPPSAPRRGPGSTPTPSPRATPTTSRSGCGRGPTTSPPTSSAASAWQRALFDGGWAGITWPKEYGGRGGKSIEQVIFNQEQAQFGVSSGAFMISIGMAGPTILAHGTDEQKDRFLPPDAAGRRDVVPALQRARAPGRTWPNLSTRAERDGDEWVVTGQKVWTSSPDRARWGMLLARTDGGVPKHRGISYFLLDMTTPGHRRPAAAADDRREPLLRGVPRRRAHPGRQPARRRGRGLARHADHAQQRALIDRRGHGRHTRRR